MKNLPTRAEMFAALAPKTEEELAIHDEERAAVRLQHSAGLNLEKIVAVASATRIGAIIHASHFGALAEADPVAAEVVRDACHRRLIDLSR